MFLIEGIVKLVWKLYGGGWTASTKARSDVSFRDVSWHLLPVQGGNRPLPADAANGKVVLQQILDAEAGLLEGGAPVEASGVPSNADPKDDLFGPEEAKELISEEAAQKRNQKWVEAIRKEAQE